MTPEFTLAHGCQPNYVLIRTTGCTTFVNPIAANRSPQSIRKIKELKNMVQKVETAHGNLAHASLCESAFFYMYGTYTSIMQSRLIKVLQSNHGGCEAEEVSRSILSSCVRIKPLCGMFDICPASHSRPWHCQGRCFARRRRHAPPRQQSQTHVL